MKTIHLAVFSILIASQGFSCSVCSTKNSGLGGGSISQDPGSTISATAGNNASVAIAGQGAKATGTGGSPSFTKDFFKENSKSQPGEASQDPNWSSSF